MANRQGTEFEIKIFVLLNKITFNINRCKIPQMPFVVLTTYCVCWCCAHSQKHGFFPINGASLHVHYAKDLNHFTKVILSSSWHCTYCNLCLSWVLISRLFDFFSRNNHYFVILGAITQFMHNCLDALQRCHMSYSCAPSTLLNNSWLLMDNVDKRLILLKCVNSTLRQEMMRYSSPHRCSPPLEAASKERLWPWWGQWHQ